MIENRETRLVLADDARVLSLLHRPTQTECLAPGTDIRAFSTLQHRGYGGNIGPRVVPASEVRREGDRLMVSFASLVNRAVIRLRITEAYIGFILEKIEGDASFAAGTARPAYYNEDTLPFDELIFLQLPVKARGRFGDWLNVAWDDRVAVNLLATDPFTRVDAVSETGRHLLRAAAVNQIRREGIGAALIVTDTAHLLDRIDQVEDDFGLPAGVRSRRRPEAALSYWKVNDPVTAANADRYIRVARAGGLRNILLYHRAFARTPGHFPWREEYPHGESDLRAAVDRLAEAGITTGLHLHFTKAHVDDAYVRPVPDRRLNLRRHFTLARILAPADSEIEVLEDPSNSTLDGWIQFRPPGRATLGMQPDIIEYATSRAAGWDCPISIIATLRDLEATPRTADNLEVIRRWEEVREKHWLTAEQQRELQRASPEHTLLVNEAGQFELVPCLPIPIGPPASTARGVLFERRDSVWVAFWDTRGTSRLMVRLPTAQLRRFRELGRELAVEGAAAGTVLEVSDRHYLHVRGATAREVETALATATTLPVRPSAPSTPSIP